MRASSGEAFGISERLGIRGAGAAWTTSLNEWKIWREGERIQTSTWFSRWRVPVFETWVLGAIGMVLGLGLNVLTAPAIGSADEITKFKLLNIPGGTNADPLRLWTAKVFAAPSFIWSCLSLLSSMCVKLSETRYIGTDFSSSCFSAKVPVLPKRLTTLGPEKCYVNRLRRQPTALGPQT